MTVGEELLGRDRSCIAVRSPDQPHLPDEPARRNSATYATSSHRCPSAIVSAKDGMGMPSMPVSKTRQIVSRVGRRGAAAGVTQRGLGASSSLADDGFELLRVEGLQRFRADIPEGG